MVWWTVRETDLVKVEQESLSNQVVFLRSSHEGANRSRLGFFEFRLSVWPIVEPEVTDEGQV